MRESENYDSNLKLLFVEDDLNVTDAIKEVCDIENIACDIANDGETGCALALNSSYDLIVLDIMLPKMSGLDLLALIRERKPNVPVLMLTAKGTVEDKVECLDLGADDYMVKPFSLRELFARVRALSRRNASRYDANVLRFEDIVFEPKKRVMSVNGQEQVLSLKESCIMERLIADPAKIISREELADWVSRKLKKAQKPKNMDVYVHKLRKRFDGSRATIDTIRGIGFSLRSIYDELDV